MTKTYRSEDDDWFKPHREPYHLNPHGLKLEPISPEQIKFEEIKQMAWEIFKDNKHKYLAEEKQQNLYGIGYNWIQLAEIAWGGAEAFCNFAKKKQEEVKS